MVSFSHLQQPSSGAMAKRRKILMAAPFPPRRNGLHGGSSVIAQTIDELAEHHSVAVAYLRGRDEPSMEEALVERCAVVEEVPRPAGRSDLRSLLQSLWAWTRGTPLWVEDWRVPQFRERLHRMVESWRPDVMQFEFHIMAQYVDQAVECAT